MTRAIIGERIAAEDESADQQPNSDEARHPSLPAFEWIRILVRAGRHGNRRRPESAAAGPAIRPKYQ
jgi:hypothetical protein